MILFFSRNIICHLLIFMNKEDFKNNGRYDANALFTHYILQKLMVAHSIEWFSIEYVSLHKNGHKIPSNMEFLQIISLICIVFLMCRMRSDLKIHSIFLNHIWNVFEGWKSYQMIVKYCIAFQKFDIFQWKFLRMRIKLSFVKT